MFRRLGILAAALAAAVLLVQPSAGSRRDQPLCFGSPATIAGSGMIEGTNGDDVIVGSDGDDVIHARGGHDKLCGGAGADRIGAGPGDDRVDGGSGNDQLLGGDGDDRILGGDGDDTIECGTGNDTADGGPGTNTAVTSGFETCEHVTTANRSTPEYKPKALRATLDAAQEVQRPTGVRRGAGGLLTASLTLTETGATFTWRLTFTRLTGTAVAADIAIGGPGKNGRILTALCRPCVSPAQGDATVGLAAKRAILQGGTYVNVHTKRNPRGEIRGQIGKVG